MTMGALALDFSQSVPFRSEIGSLGALYEEPVLPKPEASEDRDIIFALSRQISRQLAAAINSKSRAEFMAVRNEGLPRYARALRALSDTVMNLFPESVLGDLAPRGFELLSDDLERSQVLKEELKEQALFTLWTLKKVRPLTRQLSETRWLLDDEKKKRDAELALEYNYYAIGAQFHLDAVMSVIRLEKNVNEEVQHEMCNGLRALVNAYTIIQDGLSLRHTTQEPALSEGLPWDEEDADLLASSMKDIG